MYVRDVESCIFKFLYLIQFAIMHFSDAAVLTAITGLIFVYVEKFVVAELAPTHDRGRALLPDGQ
jgi:hypothetical protein